MKHVEHVSSTEARVEPRWRRSLSESLLAIWAFLATAVTTIQLAWALRRRVQQARCRERVLRLLHDQAQELAALQERQHLACQLHDSICQALYGMSLGAHTACEALESNDSDQAKASLKYVLALA